MNTHTEDPLGGCRGMFNGCLFALATIALIVIAVIVWRHA